MHYHVQLLRHKSSDTFYQISASTDQMFLYQFHTVCYHYHTFPFFTFDERSTEGSVVHKKRIYWMFNHSYVNSLAAGCKMAYSDKDNGLDRQSKALTREGDYRTK